MTISLAQLQAVDNPKMTFPGLREDVVTPYPYQVVDAAYLCLNPRTLVAEYTGAGKKLIVILALLKLGSLGRAKNALILSIPDDIDQWTEEINAFTDGLTVDTYRGTPAYRKSMRDQEHPADVWVSTYTTAMNDLRHLLGRFDVIVPDEASILRNPDTALQPAIAALCAPTHREMSLYLMAKHRLLLEEGRIPANSVFQQPTFHGDPARFVWPLTATPYETGPMNVWSGYNVMLGQASPLGKDPTRFERNFCVVEKPKITVRGKGGKKFSIRIKKIKGIKENMKPRMKELVGPYYVRHPWPVVAAHLPSVKVIPHWMDLSTAQNKIYTKLAEEDILLSEFARYDGVPLVQGKQVSSAVRFHYQTRVCDGLYALPNQLKNDSTKMQWTMGMLRGELAYEKVVIFSLRYNNLDRIAYQLGQDGTPCLRIDGHPDRTDEDNTKARHAFMDPDGPKILLVTMKAMRALNLQVANHMICYNTMTNPKANEQLFGRIARRKADGSTEPVIIHMPLCRDTVEENIIWPYNRNRETESTELFGSKFEENPYSNLTPAELESLR